jgi:hypothetical protein
MATHVYTARPRDTRYADLQTLVDTAAEDKRLSAERTLAVRDLHAITVNGEIMLAGPRGAAHFTHWSWGQACRVVGAPARYLSDLAPDLGAQCLTHGLQRTDGDAVILVRAPNGRPEPVIRAITSETYGRVWDADLGGALLSLQDQGWRPPTGDEMQTRTPQCARSDRDSAITLIHPDTPIADPSSDLPLYRTVKILNSEVGAKGIWILVGMMRALCSNLQIWQFDRISTYKRRHVGAKALRDSIRAIARLSRELGDQSVARDEGILRLLTEHEIATTRVALVAELRELGATQVQAEAAYDSAEADERVSPRSYWGAAQGLTRIAQASGYEDQRLQLDRIAGQVLARGRARVSAAV